MMNELHEDPLMIWRNTVPGHPGCQPNRFGKPIENIEEASEIIESCPPAYGWNRFHYQNEISTPMFVDKGFKLMDVFTSGVLRSDSHKGFGDCLHYCIPGPVDHWVRMFYNIFIENELTK